MITLAKFDELAVVKKMKSFKRHIYERIIYENELDQLHREDGPAVEYFSGPYKGHKAWYINDKLHRLDGPAMEYPGGNKSWYFHGKYIKCKTQEEFERIIKLAILW